MGAYSSHFKSRILLLCYFSWWIFKIQLAFSVETQINICDVFIQFQRLVHNQLEKNIKVVQTDGGGEFLSASFWIFLQQNGIRHQISCPHSHSRTKRVGRKRTSSCYGTGFGNVIRVKYTTNKVLGWFLSDRNFTYHFIACIFSGYEDSVSGTL